MQVGCYVVRKGIWKADAVSATQLQRDFQQLEGRKHLRTTARIVENKEN